MNPEQSTPGRTVRPLFGLAVLALSVLQACSESTPHSAVAVASAATASTRSDPAPRSADFGSGAPTADVRWLVGWIADANDNGDRAFIVVDKRAAEVHVFDAQARWLASSPVLLGVALGDDSVPGIGSRPMDLIEPHERTTPAGRFIAELGRNAAGEDVVWVDYDTAVSMHRVRLTNSSEHRADRLASPTPEDNRISYGCINLPVDFYERHVHPVFEKQKANVYVLPDSRMPQQEFGAMVLASSAKRPWLLLALAHLER